MTRSAKPHRIQLSRAKGWRMPPNTVKVDRSTKWGNPFVVGKHGTQAECVDLFTKLLCGYMCLSRGPGLQAQHEYVQMLERDRAELKGKNLACWCRPGQPCHADVLLRLKHPRRRTRTAS